MQLKQIDEVPKRARTFMREVQAISREGSPTPKRKRVTFEDQDMVLKQLRKTTSKPLSTNETTRIRRALYRYELYCNMFGPQNYMLHEHEVMVFLRLFPPWEVEEIGCIHTYLQNRLTIFGEIVYHWGQGLSYEERAVIRMKTFHPTY